MRDMSRFLAQVGIRAAVNQVTAEGALAETCWVQNPDIRTKTELRTNAFIMDQIIML